MSVEYHPSHQSSEEITMNNRFTGEHSRVLINLDHVIYAMGGDYAGSTIKIYMFDGLWVVLTGAEADMFREQWRERNTP